MLVPKERGYKADMIGASAMILVGIMFMIDRIDNVVLRYTPRLQQVQQWWPLALIGVGLVLLLVERGRARS